MRNKGVGVTSYGKSIILFLYINYIKYKAYIYIYILLPYIYMGKRKDKKEVNPPKQITLERFGLNPQEILGTNQVDRNLRWTVQQYKQKRKKV